MSMKIAEFTPWKYRADYASTFFPQVFYNCITASVKNKKRSTSLTCFGGNIGSYHFDRNPFSCYECCHFTS